MIAHVLLSHGESASRGADSDNVFKMFFLHMVVENDQGRLQFVAVGADSFLLLYGALDSEFGSEEVSDCLLLFLFENA